MINFKRFSLKINVKIDLMIHINFVAEKTFSQNYTFKNLFILGQKVNKPT